LGIPIGLRANDDAALDQAIEHLPMTRIVPSTRLHSTKVLHLRESTISTVESKALSFSF